MTYENKRHPANYAQELIECMGDKDKQIELFRTIPLAMQNSTRSVYRRELASLAREARQIDQERLKSRKRAYRGR